MNLSEKFSEKEIKRMEKIPFYRDVCLWMLFLVIGLIMGTSINYIYKAYQYADSSGFLDYYFWGIENPSEDTPHEMLMFVFFFSTGIYMFSASIFVICMVLFFRRDSLKWKSYRLILSMIEMEKQKDVTN